jgi:hypothetical protein
MAIRIPQNQIVESKYTVGKEYLLLSTHKEYQGYYYELNNKTFAGKEFNTNAPEIIKITSDKVNPLLLNTATYLYGLLSKVKINNTKFNSLSKLDDPDIDTFPDITEVTNTYYSKKINSNIIKQISKETFSELQSNPLYVTTSVNPDNSNIDEADKIIPGLKDFILVKKV